MIFGSVCSGIEAASVAWEPLGWRAAWFAEIEPFPSAVLKHHYPDTPNLGDMTALPDRIRLGEVEAPDLFCGGTPCQAFSVAGLRKSLDDARGNLSLTFCEIANAIDHVRSARGEQPAIVFWENVPGVLSTADNAFGCFLSALAGCDTAIDPLAATGWTNAGVVAGPQRTVAWRVLDAQYFGLAQRRKRVFVVASARAGFDPVEVLLEFDGVRRDSAPSREAGKRPAAGAATGAAVSSGHGYWLDAEDKAATLRAQDSITKADTLISQAFGGNRTSGSIEVTPALLAQPGSGWKGDFESETFLVQPTHTLRGEGFDASEDGTGRGTPLVPVHVPDIAGTMMACKDSGGWSNSADHAAAGYMVPVSQPYTLAIRGRGDSHNLEYRQDGTANALLTPNGGRGGIGVGAVATPVAFSIMPMNSGKDYKAREVDVAQPLMAAGPVGGNQGGDFIAQPVGVAVDLYNQTITGDVAGSLTTTGGGPLSGPSVMQPIAFHPTQDPISSTDVCHSIGTGSGQGCATAAVTVRTANTSANGHGISTELAYTLDQAQGQAVAFAQNQRDEVRVMDVAGALAAEPGAKQQTYLHQAMQVRRLTPEECEALQGFPRGYTAIPWRNKPASECPDGPRYKALGNSWAVPVVRWIGVRIAAQLSA